MDKAQFKDGTFCELCKTTVRYLDVLLEANATKEKIEDALLRVCNFLPDSVQTEVS